jgi:NitT/TauT family transport system substrate-binding protein
MLGRSWRRGFAALTAVAGLALAVGACGGDDETGGSEAAGGGTTAQEMTTMTVGLIPIIDVAPIYIGMEQGFFEERGIKIEPQLAAGGAAIVPAVVSGDNEIGFSNNVSLIIAKAKEVPIRVIAAGVGVSPDTTSGDENVGYCTVLAPKDGDIRDVADLEGKSIAVNTLNNIGDVTIRAALEEAGVDPDSVKFQEIPFPDMPAALGNNRVDAAWECEPFVSGLLEEGARPILNNYGSTDPNLSVASYFTSDRFAEQNPEVVERFLEGLEESMAYASENPDAVRQAITEYARVDRETAQNVGLPEFPTDFNRESIQKLVDLSVRYGLIEEKVPLDELIQTP